MARKIPIEIPELDIEILKGKGYKLELTWGDSNGPYNLSSGWKARFVGRLAPGEPAIFSLSEADGIVLSATSPNIVITIPSSATGTLTENSFLHGFELEDPGSVVKPMFIGSADLIESIV